MKIGAPGTLALALTEEGHVLITIHAADGTEVNMALTWTSWAEITGSLYAARADRQRQRVIAQRNRLKEEAEDALSE